MKIAVKEVGKELQIVETSQKYRTGCAKEYTGKEDRAEYVKLNNNGTLVIAVNENGLLHEMPTNFLLATTNPKYPIQKIVGTVAFIRTKYVNPWATEIEVEDLTFEDIQLITDILSDEHQSYLQENFTDYGLGDATFFVFK